LARYFDAVVAAAAQLPPPVAHSELRCITAGGSPLWVAVSWTITPPDDAGRQFGIVHLRDITQEKATRRELATVRARLELAFDCAPIGIAVVGLDGRLLQTNRALQSLLGYQADQLAALSFLDITYPEDRADAVAVFDQLRDGSIKVHETLRRYLRRDGRVVYTRRIAAAAPGPDQRADYILLQIEGITAERRATDRLVELAESDPLTGLATRASLARHADLSGQPRSLVLAELNDLPHLTSVLGRAGLDQLIRQLARRLSSRCRSSDVLARVGDSDFAILAVDPQGTVGPAVASRLAEAFAEPIVVDGQPVGVSAHVGVATDPSGAQQLDALVQHATLEARTQNAAGRRPAVTFQPRMLAPSARQLALETDLRRALGTAQLTLVYQPIVDVADGTIRSVEALARWDHDALGAIAPEEFIPVAERSNLVDELMKWSLHTACTDLAGWRASHPRARDLAVAVNLSAISLANPAFAATVTACLDSSAIPANRLILELTETALAAADAAIPNADLLRRLGVRLALDDFGAGYSSLVRLTRFPITELKLDRALTHSSVRPETQRALVRASVNLAADLGLTVVAEGIETQEQLDLIRACGCPQAQGYLFAAPQTAADLTDLLTGMRTPIPGS
jgi:PAS domain S-box-containing protein/diguanylate cyclase (GGDEF)-like protein